MRAIPTLGLLITMGAERVNMAIICCIRYFQCIKHSLVSSLYCGTYHGWARRKIFRTRVPRWLENAIMRLIFANTIHAFFYKEPTSRPSSKSSLFIDLKSANCSTKSSLIVP